MEVKIKLERNEENYFIAACANLEIKANLWGRDLNREMVIYSFNVISFNTIYRLGELAAVHKFK